jgi:hypothetical protein
VTAPRIAILFGVVILPLVLFLFYPEAGALFWHLRHGSSAELGGLSFHVPAFYSANTPGQNILYMVAVPGRARNYFKAGRPLKVSMISLHQLQRGETQQFARLGDPKEQVKTLDLSGNTGQCIESAGGAIWSRDEDVEIFCEFQEGMEAHFSGTTEGVKDFYRILQTSHRTQGQN